MLKPSLQEWLLLFFVCLIEIVLVFFVEIQISKYQFEWKSIPLKFAIFTFGMWMFFYQISNKRLEFEAEQSYHRRRGRAAVEGQKAEEESRKSLTHDFKGFRRMNPRVN